MGWRAKGIAVKLKYNVVSKIKLNNFLLISRLLSVEVFSWMFLLWSAHNKNLFGHLLKLQRLDRAWYDMDSGYDETQNPFADVSEEYTKKKEETMAKKAVKRMSAQQRQINKVILHHLLQPLLSLLFDANRAVNNIIADQCCCILSTTGFESKTYKLL